MINGGLAQILEKRLKEFVLKPSKLTHNEWDLFSIIRHIWISRSKHTELDFISKETGVTKNEILKELAQNNKGMSGKRLAQRINRLVDAGVLVGIKEEREFVIKGKRKHSTRYYPTPFGLCALYQYVKDKNKLSELSWLSQVISHIFHLCEDND